MLYFASDYMESGHEAIFRRFLETAGEHLTAYGTDRYCRSAAEKIRAASSATWCASSTWSSAWCWCSAAWR